MKNTGRFLKGICAESVTYSDQGLAYLLQEYYIKRNRKLRVRIRVICVPRF
jgi:hypothetical protein